MMVHAYALYLCPVLCYAMCPERDEMFSCSLLVIDVDGE